MPRKLFINTSKKINTDRDFTRYTPRFFLINFFVLVLLLSGASPTSALFPITFITFFTPRHNSSHFQNILGNSWLLSNKWGSISSRLNRERPWVCTYVRWIKNHANYCCQEISETSQFQKSAKKKNPICGDD